MARTVLTSTRPQQTMVTMLGLHRRSFRLAVAMVMVVYVAVGIALPHDSAHRHVVTVVASIGLGVSLWLAARGDRDPVGVPAAVTSVLLGALSAGAVWWSVSVGPLNWVRPGAPFVAYTIAVALLAVRGRGRLAWIGFALVCGTAAVAALAWDWGGGTAAQVAVRMLVSLVPVTLVMAFVRPLLTFARVLDHREVAAVAREAAQTATVQQRGRQSADLNRDVRPILEKVAAGAPITEAEAADAHLLEHALRDGIRGEGWMSPEVREAVAQARSRGADIRLWDDRGPGDSTVDGDILRAGLVGLLRTVDDGTVTARLLPRGRDAVAVVATQRGERVDRRYCRLSAEGRTAWEDESGGAVSM